jgi:hypothetical protein
VFLSFVDPKLVQRHLRDQAVAPAEVNRLLTHRRSRPAPRYYSTRCRCDRSSRCARGFAT